MRYKESVDKLFPHLIPEWASDLNDGKQLNEFTPGSEFRAWWRCAENKDHVWQAVINKRALSARGCPYCAGRYPSAGHNLRDKHPQIAAEWHPTRNGGALPEHFTPVSGRKVWWQCPLDSDHDYRTSIAYRTNQGSGCPYCAGIRLHPSSSLASKFPEVAQSWHPSKNGDLTPSDVSWGTNKKFYWLCDNDPEHDWYCSVNSRTSRDSKCSVCTNRTLGRGNSLAERYPDIASTWHPENNGEVTPKDVVGGGNKRYWWLCPFGHEWETSIATRIRGSNCPFCTNQTSRLEIRVFCELKSVLDCVVWRGKVVGREVDIFLPDFSVGIEVDGKTWHVDKEGSDQAKGEALENAGVDLIRVREEGLPKIGSHDVIYTAKESHAAILSRLYVALGKHDKKLAHALHQCSQTPKYRNESEYRIIVSQLPAPPIGRSLASLSPESVKSWDYARNHPLTPEMFSPQSNKLVYWKCSSGHSWEKSIDGWERYAECPKCHLLKNSLAECYPEIAETWHPTKNGELTPRDVMKRGDELVWWRCRKGHEWQATVAHRTKPRNCPECAGKKVGKDNSLAVKRPDIAVEWHIEMNKSLSPDEVTYGSAKAVWWQCPKSELHVYEAPVKRRTTNGSGCPFCAGKQVCADNSLEALRPELSEEWHPSRNQDQLPCDFTYKSGQKVWWLCHCGHEWKAKIIDRSAGAKCPRCKKRAQSREA
jgi:very-short-patch-repair endonuclease